MLLPHFLLPYRKQAEEFLKQGAVKEVFFTGSTYQVKIFDKNAEENYWTYLEYDDEGGIKDCFCECESADAEGYCVHIAVAYLEATKKGHPQHEKYKRSIYSLFHTFSSHEMWVDGKPIEGEVEPLATALFQRQEKGELNCAEYSLDQRAIPSIFILHFQDKTLELRLEKDHLIEALPYLSSLALNLEVFSAEDRGIEKLIYDKKRKEFFIEKKTLEPVEGIEIGQGWIYVKDEGFYGTKYSPLFEKEVIEEEEFKALFEGYPSLLEKQLKNTEAEFHPKIVQPSYALFFDKEFNLHITAYLFTKGDLTEKADLFPPYAFIEKTGFFLFSPFVFGEVEHVVEEEAVADFIEEQRDFLEYQKGFIVSVAAYTSALDYELKSNNVLVFFHKKEKERKKRFGSFCYVEGKGFFEEKGIKEHSLAISDKTIIPSARIAFFIRENKKELSKIEGFFSEKQYIKKMQLDIRLLDKKLCLTPTYQVEEEALDKELVFFEEFIYLKGEGFSEIPKEKQLPHQKFEIQWIEEENIDDFVKNELGNYLPLISEIDSCLISPKEIALTSEQIGYSEGIYKLKISYKTEKGTIAFFSLWQEIAKGKKYFYSPAGLLDLSEERFFWIAEVQKSKIDPLTNIVELTLYELIRMSIFEPKENKKVQDLLYEMKELKTPKDPDLTGFNSTLRSYQHVGVNWLWFLCNNHLSGLLCDEMGLGKTHQSMAMIAALKNQCIEENKQKTPRFLVLCPTSVLYHWFEKLQKFFPEVRVLLFHGRERNLDTFFKDYDVLLTSYGVWRNEFQLLKQFSFELAIFDEIQAAKNPASRLFSALKQVNAKMRISMTGTPIENNLRDLKALFDLTLPGYLPSAARFRRYFSKPIEKENNLKRRQLLHRLISPFFLRRKKAEVLFDLPPKIEEIMHCPLSEDQRLIYQEILEKRRQSLLEDLHHGDSPIPYLHIFSVLTSLKQICNHPASYYKTPENYKEYGSGKWDLFVELLNEALDSDQKVIVFSQYLSMLDIIELYLQEKGVKFSSIRGATQDRGEAVNSFNNDESCKVFVGSLHAAGYGIDLTAGSVVLHYDRWWNAAKEEQATGRAHRMGQTRGVQVFKLVTKGSFEERIDQIIEQKGALLEEVIGFDDHRVIKTFSREDLISLLQDVQEDSN
jgi:superfamily II DNA or RNA helicase